MARLAGDAAILLVIAVVAELGPELVSPHGEDGIVDLGVWQHQDAWNIQELSLADVQSPGGVASFGVTGQSGQPHGPPGHSHADSNSTLKGGSVPHVLVIYHSVSHHTEYMANIILNGALDLIPPCHIEVLSVQKANYSVLTDWADVLVVGTPVLNRQPADEILAYLQGITAYLPAVSRIRGATFATAGGIGGGQELVIDRLNGIMQSLGIVPLSFPDCRYQLGLTAITGFPPFCRSQTDSDTCAVSQDAPAGQIHPKFEGFGYEYGRSLIRMLSDPNAEGGPY